MRAGHGRRGEGASVLAFLASVAALAYGAAGLRTSPRMPSAALVEMARAAVALRDGDMAGAGRRVRGYVEAGQACMRSLRRPCVVSGDELTLDFGAGRYAVDVAPIEGVTDTVRHVAVEADGVIRVVDPEMFDTVVSQDITGAVAGYAYAR